jgi:hypothetical protein
VIAGMPSGKEFLLKNLLKLPIIVLINMSVAIRVTISTDNCRKLIRKSIFIQANF